LIKILAVVKTDDLPKYNFANTTQYNFYRACKEVASCERNQPDLEASHKGISPEWLELINACLKLNPIQRLPVEELLRLPLFDTIKSEPLQNSAFIEDELMVQVDFQKVCKQTGKQVQVATHKYQRYIVDLISSINECPTTARGVSV
jgi:chemotaxis regulatin CheY-phosphate phosphatase CheZ